MTTQQRQLVLDMICNVILDDDTIDVIRDDVIHSDATPDDDIMRTDHDASRAFGNDVRQIANEIIATIKKLK